MISARGDQELCGAQRAGHNVVPAPSDCLKPGSAFVLDPATGALVLRPDLDLIFRKALRRQARMIALRLYLQLFPLYLRKLQLPTACLRRRSRNRQHRFQFGTATALGHVAGRFVDRLLATAINDGALTGV